MSPRQQPSHLAVGIAVIASFFGMPNAAPARDFGADVSLASTYTSNLFLAPKGQEDDQWVNSVLPRFYWSRAGGNYQIDVDYEGQAFFYARNPELNELYNELWATGVLGVIGEQLDLRGFARATQVNVDPEAPIIDNNLLVTGNRANARAWEIGPRWTSFVARSELDAHYYVGRIEYDNEDSQAVVRQDGQMRLRSDLQSTRRVSYDLQYRYRNFDYEETGDTEFQDLRFELGLFTSPFFQVIGIAGAETNLAKNDGKLDEPFWEAGFRAWLGHNSVLATYGERYYGDTYRLRWDRQMLNSNFLIAYDEVQTTDEGVAFDAIAEDERAGIDPAQNPSLTPDNRLESPGSGSRFLNKRLRADYRLNTYRTELRIYAFRVEREQFFAATISPVNPTDRFSKDESLGGGADVTWEVGAKTSLNARGQWTRREFDTEQQGSSRRSDVWRADLRLRYSLGLWTDLIGRVGYLDQSQTNSSEDLDEYHAAIEIRRYFFDRR